MLPLIIQKNSRRYFKYIGLSKKDSDVFIKA